MSIPTNRLLLLILIILIALLATSTQRVRAQADSAVPGAETQRELWIDSRTAPDWLNAFVCVDLVKLGYAPPDVTWGMHFENGKYTGGQLSPYEYYTIANMVIKWVLVHPDRVKEMYSYSPEAYETLVRALAELGQSIVEWIPGHIYSPPDGAILSGEVDLTPEQATQAVVGNLLFIIETELEGQDDHGED